MSSLNAPGSEARLNSSDRPGGAVPERDKLAEIAGGQPAGEKTQPMPGGRRGARALAVQALYEADVAAHKASDVVERLALASRLSEENVGLARELVGFVEKEKTDLDRRIDGATLKFPTARMAAVSRNLLRVSLAETTLHPETSRAVVITESVELARLFGGDGSPGFVHGLLGALLR